ncbi:MAG TPA: class I SAM-dependent methyltransferase [Burkholderiaceae bacterium]
MASTQSVGPTTNGTSSTGYFSNTRAEMLPYFPLREGRVLEVGCGEGVFSAQLKQELPSLEVWGVEPDAEAVRKASARLDKVLPGFFEARADLPAASFDCLVFNDSLEHMPDHMKALHLAHSLLHPGGFLVASIPNVLYWPHVQHYLIKSDWKYEDKGILDRTHLRFFTRKSLQRDLVQAGFSIERLEGINSCDVTLKFKALRLFFPRQMADMPFMQFAVVARKT